MPLDPCPNDEKINQNTKTAPASTGGGQKMSAVIKSGHPKPSFRRVYQQYRSTGDENADLE